MWRSAFRPGCPCPQRPCHREDAANQEAASSHAASSEKPSLIPPGTHPGEQHLASTCLAETSRLLQGSSGAHCATRPQAAPERGSRSLNPGTCARGQTRGLLFNTHPYTLDRCVDVLLQNHVQLLLSFSLSSLSAAVPRSTPVVSCKPTVSCWLCFYWGHRGIFC